LDATSLPALFVGKYLSFTAISLANGFVGVPYQFDFAKMLSYDESKVTSVEFEMNWDGDDPGLSLSTGGVLSGSPSLSGSFLVTIIASGGAGDEYRTFIDVPIIIRSAPLELYSFSPAAVPAVGGNIVLRGQGFESDAKVWVSGVKVQATYIDQSIMSVFVPGLLENEYTVEIHDDGDSAQASGKITVASASEMSYVMGSTVEGVADVTDYEMIGLRGFYQGGFREIVESAFGDYDAQGGESYRVFYYSGSHQELDSLPRDSDVALRSGEGFWRISRVSGEIDLYGVDDQSVSSYDVTISAQSWHLLANVYSSNVVWTDVQVITGGSDARVMSVEEATASKIVSELWGMDKNSDDPLRPYIQMAQMESAKAYWVKNTSDSAVTLRVHRPQVVGLSSTKVLLKPGAPLPPEAPQTYQKAASGLGAPSAGGGGCLLKGY
jgi:hypothetical protein